MNINKLFSNEPVIQNANIIDGIYDILAGDEYGNNAFMDRNEKLESYNRFAARYIDTIRDGNKQDKAFSDFIEAVNEARHVAFKLGFQAAVKLFDEIS